LQRLAPARTLLLLEQGYSLGENHSRVSCRQGYKLRIPFRTEHSAESKMCMLNSVIGFTSPVTFLCEALFCGDTPDLNVKQDCSVIEADVVGTISGREEKRKHRPTECSIFHGRGSFLRQRRAPRGSNTPSPARLLPRGLGSRQRLSSRGNDAPSLSAPSNCNPTYFVLIQGHIEQSSSGAMHNDGAF
jgi:hypothetical protein